MTQLKLPFESLISQPWSYQSIIDQQYDDLMEYEGSCSSQERSIDGTSTSLVSESSINFVRNKNNSPISLKGNMEIAEQLSIFHLLKALGEATENQYDDLAYVISRKLKEKACPNGPVLHRLAYYLVRSSNSHLDQCCMAQEATKNYDLAFSLFYQIFPYGRLAHFVSNSIILAALPKAAKMISIVDFDLGEGVQWPPLIEAISKKHPKLAIRLICLKWDEYDLDSPLRNFRSTKDWLNKHANTYSFGLELMIEEMGVEELSMEMKRIANSKEKEKKWVVFNCMSNLPHMRKQRSSSLVAAFLLVAQEYLGRNRSNRDIIVSGSGSIFSTFESELRRTKALLELMELHMPLHLSEARMVMECLFIAPCVGKLGLKRSKDEIFPNIGLRGLKLSEYVIEEAKELVEEDQLYQIRTEGKYENEVVLSFKGTPILRVSNWIS